MPRGCVLTIGNFDGVHLGHQAILGRAAEFGRQLGLPVKALTFAPHPLSVLRPGSQPPKLLNVERRIAELKRSGAHEVVVLEPTPRFLHLGPEEFMQRVMDEHQPAVVVEGPAFRFGKDRAGDVSTLTALGQTMGFEFHVVEQVDVALTDLLLVAVSSSLVRWLVEQGRVADAAICLGRPHEVWGVITGGHKRGRAMGLATANLDRQSLTGYAVPGHGVYAGWGVLENGKRYPAAISVGRQATFGAGDVQVEAHLLDFDADLYNQRVGIEWARWVRPQRAFPSGQELKNQILRDIDTLRTWQAMGLLETDRGGGRASPIHTLA